MKSLRVVSLTEYNEANETLYERRRSRWVYRVGRPQAIFVRFSGGAHRGRTQEARINHRRGAIAEFLIALKPGTSVAVETIGNWYWIVDGIEAAGMVPQLVHARRATMMLPSVNKTTVYSKVLIAPVFR
jgi:hypothetical protein